MGSRFRSEPRPSECRRPASLRLAVPGTGSARAIRPFAVPTSRGDGPRPPYTRRVPEVANPPVALIASSSEGDGGESAIRVRMLANWCDSRTLCELFNRMSSNNDYEWHFLDAGGARRQIRMTWDDNDPDYWVVINGPQAADESHIDPARTVVFHMEPLMWTDTLRPLWGRWASPSPLSFIQVRDHRHYRNSNDWWLGLSYTELNSGPSPDKDRFMAACVSTKYFDPGHRKRIDFLPFLDGGG